MWYVDNVVTATYDVGEKLLLEFEKAIAFDIVTYLREREFHDLVVSWLLQTSRCRCLHLLCKATKH
jgi:hypothetical protein